MTRKELRKQEITTRRREQILSAAREVFARKGFTDATMPEIAKIAGIASGTIYIYFPTKRELFVGVIESLMITPLATVSNKDTKPDFLNTLKGSLQERFMVLQSESFPSLLSLMSEIQRDSELRAIFISKLIKPVLASMEDMYLAGSKAGEFRKIDPEVAVRLIGSVMMGMNLLKSIEGEASPLNKLSRERVADETMAFILYGLLNSKNMV